MKTEQLKINYFYQILVHPMQWPFIIGCANASNKGEKGGGKLRNYYPNNYG